MDNEYLKRIYGLLESGATLGTGAVSGLVGMPYGLYKGVTSGAYGTPQAPKIAAREAQQFMERNTYQPRTAEGQANLQQLAGLLEASKLPPVMPEASLLAAIPKQAYAAQAERAGMAAEKAIAPVVTRTMERGGMPAQLLGDLAQGSRRQIFIGEKAKAWDKPAAELAKQLEDKGLSPKEIWQQTGTARGVDGKWRQEISDAEALLTNKQKNLDGKLHESLQHPSLYENYPALQYYDAEIQSEIALPEHLKKALVGKGKGSFTEKDFVTDEPKITAQAFSNEDKGTLLHEIQHAVQSREGFARGGSPEAEFLSRGNITGDVLSPEAQLIYENKGVSKDQAAMEAYRRLAGEAEARLTADRALLTPEQRLQYFPFEERSFPNPYIEKTTDFNAYGLDVNPKNLIVRQGGLLGQSKAASALPVGQSGLLQSPRSLTMPDVPTAQQMEKYGRVETVPLSQAVSFQSARDWETFGKKPNGDLIKGYGDKPVALRLETGEYVIYDGNHRTDLAMQAGKSELPMHVIDVRSYDPAHAGRKPAPEKMTDDELLRSLLD